MPRLPGKAAWPRSAPVSVTMPSRGLRSDARIRDHPGASDGCDSPVVVRSANEHPVPDSAPLGGALIAFIPGAPRLEPSTKSWSRRQSQPKSP
jgi:hypothetical protein